MRQFQLKNASFPNVDDLDLGKTLYGDANVDNTCTCAYCFCLPRFGIFNLISSFVAQRNFRPLKLMSVLQRELSHIVFLRVIIVVLNVEFC